MAKKKMYQRPDGLYEKKLIINGKRRVFRGKTEKEVYQKIANFSEKEEKGKTFNEVADEWADKILTEIQVTTWDRAYKPLFNRILKYFDGQYIKEITATNINSYVVSISSYSQKSVRNNLSIIKQIFDFAAMSGYVSGNPAIYVKLPKNLKPAQHRHAASDSEITKIENAIGYPIFGLYGFLLLFTGLRRGEALALQWSDIDFDKKTISVTKSVYHEGNTPKLKEPKTMAGVREVFLLNKLESVLAEYKRGHKDSDFIFSTNGGLSPLTKSQVAKGWNKYTETIGISITPHQLRHTYASILYAAGIQAKSAQMLMGHSDITTTQNIYTHLMSEAKKDDMQKLNNFFDK